MTTTSRREVGVVLVALVPGWLSRGLVLGLLLAGTSGDGAASYLFVRPALLTLGMALVLGLVAVAVLSRRGHFRADEWWQAGWLVLADLLAMLVGYWGDGVWVLAIMSLLTGPWLIVFAAGSLAWRRLAALAPPRAWVDAQDREDD